MHLSRLIALMAVLAVLILPAASAGAISSLPLGNLSTASITGATFTAWEVSKTSPTTWYSTTINHRNEGSNDIGLGVCPAAVGALCPTTGNGNINEIDNNGTAFDVLRLEVASGYRLNSIGVSSLDASTDAFAIFGSNSANPSFNLLTLLASGTSAMGISPVIAISNQYTYYYIAPKNRDTCDPTSDFLVKSADLTTVSRVPEPITMSLAGLGLVLFGALRRRK